MIPRDNRYKFSSVQMILILVSTCIFLGIQQPFLEADPDINISYSRGANTDEGLHSCQIRNYINNQDLTLDQSDNFVKTPLLGYYLYAPLSLFGSKLIIGRLAIFFASILCIIIAFGSSNYNRFLLLVLFPLLFLQYHCFHFFHFCLAEILSSAFILGGIIHASKEKKNLWTQAFLSSLMISIAYYLKIQFIYVIVLLPFYHIVFAIFKKKKKKQILLFSYTSLFLLGFGILYFLSWYLPNKELFQYVMSDQTSGRFVSFQKLFDNIKHIHGLFFESNEIVHFTYAFYLLFPLGIFLVLKSSSKTYKAIFLGLSLWLLLETHKLGMTYLPSRYLISFIFPMIGICSLVLLEFGFLLWRKRKALILVPSLVGIILFIFNLQSYHDSLNRRTFAIQEINDYLSLYDLRGKKIIGPWAPSLTWQTQATSYPVWNGYFNHKDVLESQKPAIIISELDESDSNHVFSSNGIKIDDFADSIVYKKINHWNLKILWMKE